MQVKHINIPQNNTSYNFENVFAFNFPDLVVVSLVADADISCHYNKDSLKKIILKSTAFSSSAKGFSLTSGLYA